MSESILEEAQKIIYGDREKTYGSPATNLRRIAHFWSSYLDHDLDAIDVCQMMILLKMARLLNQPDHRDSLVDMAGYAALIQRVQEE